MITPKQTSNGFYAQVRLPDGSRKRIYGKTKNEVFEQYYRLVNHTPGPEDDITLDEAMLRYIVASDSLSPTTIREYRKMYATRYERIKQKKITHLTSEDMRLLISGWVRDGLSAKTIKNSYSFVMSSIKAFRPGTVFSVSLPKQTKTPPRQSEKIPTGDEVKTLLKYAEGTSAEIPIMLAAYCGMRLGEIAAIKKEDISGNRLHIHRSLARDIEGIVSEKTPKTPAGDRTIVIPDFVLEKLDPDKIPSLGGISSAYVRAMKKSGLEHFKFHSLRHFYASWMHLAGYPDKYIMKLGGWGDVTTLQRIYQHALTDVAEEIGTESALRAEQMWRCDRV